MNRINEIITDEHKAMAEQIEKTLREVLPSKTHIIVKNGISIFGGHSTIKIMFSASEKQINGVHEQFPQVVSLMLDNTTKELSVQHYCGNGGNRIFKEPNKEDPKERFLAMAGIKIPFRKPKGEDKHIIEAVKRFGENWVKAIRENKEVLCYKTYVNYEEFLAS